MTNFERIKGMSVEELAEFLDNVTSLGLDYLVGVRGFPCDYCMEKCKCESCIKEWLESECDAE